MNKEQYSPVIRSLHQISQGAYEQALDDLSEVWRRALQAGEKTWAAVLLWHCMVVSESIGDWNRAVEYGERVLLLQDDAYVRLFLFRVYRQLGDDNKASVHLRASVDLADETRDQSFLETLVRSATPDEGANRSTVRPVTEARGTARWSGQPPRRQRMTIVSRRSRGTRMRDA